MGIFLDSFPKILYDINKNPVTNYETVTNILFRMQIIKEVLDNTSAYYVYNVKDGEKPEILADNIYRNPQAYWIILYANDMMDPQYDWPLEYDNFNNYIISKYGSIANAQTTPHHYEKVIRRQINTSEEYSEIRQTIDYQNQTTTVPATYHYDYFTGTPASEYETFTVGTDTIHQTTLTQEISCYDYELEMNEKKREIKIIKPEYYTQIMSEFNVLTKRSNSPFFRKLV